MSYPWQINAAYLALASLFHSLALGVTFVVWHLMLRRLANFADRRTNAYIYYLSTLAKRVPSAIWYISGRLLMYQRERVARSVVANAIVLETALIGAAGVVVYLLLLPFYAWDSTSITWVLAGLGIAVLLAFLARPRWLLDLSNAALRRRHRPPIEVDLNRRDLVQWFSLYLLPWPLAGLSLFFMIQAMTSDMTTNLVSIIGVSTLSMLVALVSLALPAGLGLKELTIGALLSNWLPLSVGVVVAVAYRVLQTLDEVMWALVMHGLHGSGKADESS